MVTKKKKKKSKSYIPLSQKDSSFLCIDCLECSLMLWNSSYLCIDHLECSKHFLQCQISS